MKEIGPVRPKFVPEDIPAREKVERLIAGTKWHGMVIDVSELGMQINGYYTSFLDSSDRYAVLREPVVIPWVELERLRARAKKIRNKTATLDRVESEVDDEYLSTLPQVTILGRKYYIDPDRRERRAVDKPSEVWRF